MLAVSGVVLGAWYMLWLIQRVFFGPLKEPKSDSRHEPIRDLNFREIFALAPLVIFIVWIGLQPRFFLDRMSPTLKNLSAGMIKAASARDQGSDVRDLGSRINRENPVNIHSTLEKTIELSIPNQSLVTRPQMANLRDKGSGFRVQDSVLSVQRSAFSIQHSAIIPIPYFLSLIP